MYKKTTNKDRVLSQIDFVIDEMKFAIETTKDVPDESYFGTTSAGMILFRSSCDKGYCGRGERIPIYASS